MMFLPGFSSLSSPLADLRSSTDIPLAEAIDSHVSCFLTLYFLGSACLRAVNSRAATCFSSDPGRSLTKVPGITPVYVSLGFNAKISATVV